LIELVLRIGFSLLIVFGLMWGLAKVARRPLGSNRGTGALSVLHRQQLGRGSAVAVIQVADKALVVGVTDQHVSLLAETELAAFERHDHRHEHRDPIAVTPDKLEGSVLSSRTWRSAMDFLRDRTTRQ